jgi:hypothetical protein
MQCRLLEDHAACVVDVHPWQSLELQDRQADIISYVPFERLYIQQHH